MSRRPSTEPPPDLLVPPEADASVDVGEPGAPTEPSLSALPIAGITRRRTAAIVSGVLAAWIVIIFARQVSEASAATARVDQIAVANVQLQVQVATRQRELEMIGRQRYIQQQARGYGLGGAREIAFTLAPDTPPLASDAPGSATSRVGADVDDVTPLERWLTVLFGPAD